MELLLFLSALLSGLTGVISGERTAVPAGVERGAPAVAAVVEDLAEAAVAQPARISMAPSIATIPVMGRRPAQAPAPDPLSISERWLE